MHTSRDSRLTLADSTLARPRLIELIRRPFVAPVTLIAAPAGYGKSTLAEQWVKQASTDLAWVSLGSESNHPDVFQARLMAAVRAAGDGDGQRPGGNETGADVVEQLARQTRKSRPLTIVLDDVHLIENQDVLQVIDALLLARLPNVHWLLLSRTVPSLTLARLRLEGAVRDIGPDQLNFTRDEVAQIVAFLAPGQLPEEEVESLAHRTAGWIAGIRLAIMARGLDCDAHRLAAASWAATSWLDDYFMEEVLAALPEDLRTFVLRTVPLPYLDADLCDFVLETTGSAGTIEEIQKHLVFVQPHGRNRVRLAYHALFAESVARIGARFHPKEDVRETHRRAATWFRQAGLLEEAAEQAVRAQAWDFADPVIRAICRPLIDSDHSHSAWYWLSKLPREHLLDDPLLARWYISLLEHLGHHDAAEEAYARARPMWQKSGEPEDLTYDLLSQTLSLAMGGDAEQAVLKAYEAVAVAPDHLSIDLMHAWTYIYQIESFQGEDEKADHAFSEAERHRARLPADQLYWFSNTELHRVNTEAVRGRLHSAEQMYTYKLENPPQSPFYLDGKLRYRRSAIWLEWNQEDRVAGELEDLRQQAGSIQYRIWHQEALMYVAQAQGVRGDVDGMEQTLREVREMFGERGGRHNLNRLEALEVELWLATGRLPLAQDWTRRRPLESYAPPLLFGDPDPRMAHVKTHIASDEPDRALRQLAPMIEDATARRRWAEAVSLRAWQMAGHLHMGNQAEALQSLAMAIREGRPGGFVRSFMVQAPGLFPMLREALVSLPEADAAYVHALIGRGVWGAPTSVKGTMGKGALLPDPLSPREQEVLALLPVGLTNREIGERLFITERTVKRHVGSILAKLGANNRRTAVVRAWQLGLLEEDGD